MAEAVEPEVTEQVSRHPRSANATVPTHRHPAEAVQRQEPITYPAKAELVTHVTFREDGLMA
jgi:hypothetical protein